MKKAFTLMEVNLAIMIMAGGILSVLGLYGLGYRENRQGREDVIATACADAFLSPLVMALSATNITWDAFNGIQSSPGDGGWGEYVTESTGLVESDPTDKARTAWGKVMTGEIAGKAGVSTSWPSVPSGMKVGLVVMHDEDSAVVRLSFRATRNAAELLAQPLFYQEVRFQGETDLKTETSSN